MGPLSFAPYRIYPLEMNKLKKQLRNYKIKGLLSQVHLDVASASIPGRTSNKVMREVSFP